MLLVETKIGPSNIHGTGIFANQFIPKDTLIWKFKPGFDLEIDMDRITILPEPAKKQFLKYAYLNPQTNKYILCFDDARFFNHSDNPNCIDTSYPDSFGGIDIAARDIQMGEELTCNYKVFDADFDHKMNCC